MLQQHEVQPGLLQVHISGGAQVREEALSRSVITPVSLPAEQNHPKAQQPFGFFLSNSTAH